MTIEPLRRPRRSLGRRGGAGHQRQPRRRLRLRGGRARDRRPGRGGVPGPARRGRRDRRGGRGRRRAAGRPDERLRGRARARPRRGPRRRARGELGWRIQMHNRIPLARGLGSSAAATVGGLLAGAALGGATLDPDRAARARHRAGGPPRQRRRGAPGRLHDRRPRGGAPTAIRFDIPRDLRTILFIPDLRLATRDMRAALPEMVPLADAVANLQRVALGVAAPRGRATRPAWAT